jgi:hypothetical protein
MSKKITVYRFQKWDAVNDFYSISKHYATPDFIKKFDMVKIKEETKEVPVSSLDEFGLYIDPVGKRTKARPSFDRA